MVSGDHDFIPVEIAAHIAQAMPNARHVPTKDCGHFAYLECAADVAARSTSSSAPRDGSAGAARSGTSSTFACERRRAGVAQGLAVVRRVDSIGCDLAPAADHVIDVRPADMVRRSALCITVSMIALVMLTSCRRTTETIIECPSPDGTSRAVFYWIHGGGAAGSATFKLAVLDRGEGLNSGRDVLVMRHGYDVHIRWNTGSELLVEYPNRAAVDMKKDDISSVGQPPRTLRISTCQWRPFRSTPSPEGVDVLDPER